MDESAGSVPDEASQMEAEKERSSRDQDERRTSDRIRLAQIAVEALKLAWEIGNRVWR